MWKFSAVVWVLLLNIQLGLSAEVPQIPLQLPQPGDQDPFLPTTYWYESVIHNGEASFMDPSYKANYKVFRNVVTDFGADNTGNTDASVAIQNAINAGSPSGPDRTSHSMGTTGQPAVVYIPGGIYRMEKSIQLFIGTVLMGDPTNLPVLKAISDFPNDHIVYGKDPTPYLDPTVDFYIAVKNIVIDSNAIPPSHTTTLLDWTVSQATQLTNVVFNMPDYSTGHTGMSMNYGHNSNVILNDLVFNGGAVGIALNGQQWVIKGAIFNRCTTGIVGGGFNLVVTSSVFTNCTTGIEASGVSGSLTLLDSDGTNVGALVSSWNSGNSIIVENIRNNNNGQTVVINGNALEIGDVPNTWVHGGIYTSGNPNRQYQNSAPLRTPRSPGLLVNGNYFTAKPPTYEEFSVDQVVNIKTVPTFPVYGNGMADDSDNINIILKQSVNKVVYFPAGTYMAAKTIKVPPGSRIFGDAYGSMISANFSAVFFNPDAPTPLVQLGEQDDVGVGQIVDMIFTVSDVLQGCKILEVNMAGNQPGDVGVWNSHFRVGGAAGTKVRYNQACGGSPDQCKAAWGMLHLTNTSSAYIENMWGWTADHDLDEGQANPTISVGRGALIEATKGTWLVGTAMEHNTLYQYNYHNAENVCNIFQQSETPYWQGPGNDMTPQPWAANLQASDPQFKNCASGDSLCGMAWFEQISGSKNLFLYGGCVWVFFNDGGGCKNNYCQENGIEISDSTGIYLYGTNMLSISNMIRSNGQDIASSADNPGGWGGVVVAFLFNS